MFYPMTKNTQYAPKTDSLVMTDPMENVRKSLYVITEHWQSDLRFYADELHFFKILVDRHFMRLVHEEHRDATKLTVSKMGKLENRRFIIEQKVNRHLFHMANLIQDPFPRNAHSYHDEHRKLEVAMADFVKELRELKTQIFQLARRVMEEEKINHLLTT